MRMTNLHAAIGVAQLKLLSETMRRRRYVAKAYQKLLYAIPQLILPLGSLSKCKNCYWVYPTTLTDNNYYLDKFALFLKKYNIGMRSSFHSIHSQTITKKHYQYNDEDFPNSNYAYKTDIYIPNVLTLKDDEIKFVTKKNAKFFD